MTEPEHEIEDNSQDFLDDLQVTIYDHVERGGRQDDRETREGS